MELNIRSGFLVIILLLLASSAGAAGEAPCLGCHSAMRSGKVIHAAVDMGCDSCHRGLHNGEKPFPTLATAAPDLCFSCHDKTMFGNKTLHAPVASGMCLSCHTPHSSAVPKLLQNAVPELCFTCHEQKKMLMTASHIKAAGGQCLTCHNPHASDRSFVLTQLVEEHCNACHEEQTSDLHVMARVSPGDRHPLKDRPDPLRKGRQLSCSSCHNPHAAKKEQVSTKDLNDPANLCLRCHRKVNVGQ